MNAQHVMYTKVTYILDNARENMCLLLMLTSSLLTLPAGAVSSRSSVSKSGKSVRGVKGQADNTQG